MVTLARNPPGRGSQEAWTNSVAASLNSLASQFAAASTALAAVPSQQNGGFFDEVPGLAVIEQAQTRLKEELETFVRSQEEEREASLQGDVRQKVDGDVGVTGTESVKDLTHIVLPPGKRSWWKPW